jgi:FlaA1/EpsC-like NDP-sugar epimerase
MRGKKMNSRFKVIPFMLIDIIFINASIFIGYFARLSWRIPPAYMYIYSKNAIPISLIMVACFWGFKLYKSLWKYASVDELMSVILSVTCGTALSFLYGQLLTAVEGNGFTMRLPISVYLMMWAFTILSSGGIRFLIRLSYNMELVPKESVTKRKSTLVIGAGDAGAIIAKEMKKRPETGYQPIGFIDDDESKKGKYIYNIPVLGSRKDIPKIVESKNIEQILIALPSVDEKDRMEIMNICSATGCKLKTLPGIYELIDEDVSISQVRDVEIDDLLGRNPIKLNTDEIAVYLKNKVVLVTGGGGSIGSELCRQIARFSPKELLILDDYENGAYDIQMELNFKHPEVKKEVIIANIREKSRLEEIFSRYNIDVVFHAAAHKHVPLMEDNPKEAIKNNVFGTLNLAECADRYKVKKFVQISTDKAVNPTNIMGATKRVCEMIIQSIDRKSSTEFVAVRFGNVLGSNGSVIPLFKQQIKDGGPVTVTHPDIIRYFMTISEAAQLVIQAGAMAQGGEIFILDMGKPVKIVDLAKNLIRLSGFEPDKDIKIKFTGLRPGEKLYEELLMDEEGLKSTAHSKIFIGKPGEYDFEELKKELYTFHDALESDDEVVFDTMESIVPTYKRKKNNQ